MVLEFSWFTEVYHVESRVGEGTLSERCGSMTPVKSFPGLSAAKQPIRVQPVIHLMPLIGIHSKIQLCLVLCLRTECMVVRILISRLNSFEDRIDILQIS